MSFSLIPLGSSFSFHMLSIWHNDLLCILALAEWDPLYNRSTNDFVSSTNTTNKKLSKHLHTGLHLALNGSAGKIMKAHEHRFQYEGIEFLHAMKPIFYPK